MKSINTSRVLLFNTLAEAMSSPRLIHAQEVAMINGDTTRYKRGAGVENSGDGFAKPFAQLSWINNSAGVEGAVALNATATITAAQLAAKYITSTSAAATSLTLPTAALLAAQLGAVRGTVLEFIVDNTDGANTVTLVASTGIVAGTATLTGGATLTVAAGQVGYFRIFFKTNAAALIYRTM